MITTKRLNIKDKPGYYFTNMTSINDFDVNLILINEFTIFENRSIMFDINYCEKNNIPHVVFNDIVCVFRKRGINSYLVFCKTKKIKKMLVKYVKIIDEIKDQILLISEDENKTGDFIMGKDFMRVRFKTNDNLPYNQKIDVKVCVISISSVFEKGNWYYPQIELQDCFYENRN